MFVLTSVTRDDLDIIVSFHSTKEKAEEAMYFDMVNCSYFNSAEEIKKIIADKDDDRIETSGDEFWTETPHSGTVSYKITEVPAEPEN